MKKISKLIVTLFLWVSSSAQVKNFAYKSFNQANGIPGKQVMSFCFDAHNYMWISTENGICRYNGEYFKYYNHNNNIKDPAITNIVIDKNGFIWFNSFSEPGILVNDSAKAIVTNNNKKIKQATFLNEVDGAIYLAEGTTIYKANNTIVQEDIELTNTVKKLNLKDVFFIGKHNKLGWYIQSSEGLYYITNIQKKIPLSEIKGFPKMINDTIWVSTNENNTYTIFDGKLEKVNCLDNKAIYDIDKGINNEIIVGSDSVFILKNKTIIQKLYPKEISSNYPFINVGMDYLGNYWFTNYTDLFFAYSTSILTYHTLPENKKNKESLLKKWASSKDTVHVFYNKIEKDKIVLNDKNLLQEINRNKISNVLGFFKGFEKEYYIATQTKGLFKYEKHKIEPIKLVSFIENKTFATNCTVDYLQKKIWLLTTDNIICYSKNNKTITITPKDNIIFYCLLKDNNNTVWVGTSYGLKKIINNEIVDANTSNNINTTVAHLLQPVDNEIWVGTIGQGLIKINLKTKLTLQNICEKNQLKTYSVYDIKKDAYGNIWSIFNDGIKVFNKDGLLIKSYEKAVLNEDFFKGFSKLYIDSNNIVWVLNKSNVLNLGNALNNDLKITPPNAFLEKVQSNEGKDLWEKPYLNDYKDIVLSHNQNSIELHFSANYFNNIESIYYEYYIEGIDESWNTSTNSNKIRYSNLPYGTFTIHLKSKLSITGNFGKEYTKQITILAPWYLRIWAKFLWLLLLSLIIILIINWRIKMIKANAALKLNEVRQEFYSIISHDLVNPIKSYQGLGDMLGYLIKKQKFDEIKNIADQIDKTGHSIEVLLSNIQKWSYLQRNNLKIKLETLKIDTLLLELLPIYEHLATLNNVKLQVHNKTNRALYTDISYFSLIIRNLLDNAIKNAKKNTNINFIIWEFENEIFIEIENYLSHSKIETLENIKKMVNSSVLWEPNQNGIGLGLIFVQHSIRKLHAKWEFYFDTLTIKHLIKFKIHK